MGSKCSHLDSYKGEAGEDKGGEGNIFTEAEIRVMRPQVSKNAGKRHGRSWKRQGPDSSLEPVNGVQH